MEKLGHKNLFAYGDREEVYAALQRDFNRDTWVEYFWRVVFVGMAIGAATLSNHIDWLWLFGGIYAVERSISRFVDNSNRNWTMHVIDWLEHKHDGGAI
jgi:hypothetical protein